MDFNFRFIVLSPEHNVGLIQSTVNAIRRVIGQDTLITCIVGDDTPADVLTLIKKNCETYQGGKTVTSLINTGLRKSTSDWNVFITEGTQVHFKVTNKIKNFITSDKDIIFPITIDYNRTGMPINICSKFEDATLNAMTMHKQALKDIGPFSDNPLQVSKLFWSLDAMEKGYKFKGVLGIKIL